MTLNKKMMVREVGRRTRLKNRDVQAMLEALIEVWTDELVAGSGRIELENFVVIERQMSVHQVMGELQRRNLAQIRIHASRALRRQIKRI